jgi:hypothetical protein
MPLRSERTLFLIVSWFGIQGLDHACTGLLVRFNCNLTMTLGKGFIPFDFQVLRYFHISVESELSSGISDIFDKIRE